MCRNRTFGPLSPFSTLVPPVLALEQCCTDHGTPLFIQRAPDSKYWPPKTPLLAPGPAVTVDDAVLATRTPALYCSCGVVRAPENQLNDLDVVDNRKSDDDDVITPSGGVGDEPASGSNAGAGLVMQNTIRLMLPATEARTDGRRQKLLRKMQPHQSSRTGAMLIDD